MSNKSKIICLIGSTKFKTTFESVSRRETLKGNIILAPGVFGHADGIELAEQTKKNLDELHLRKIDMSDEVIVINVGGYIGESTQREIVYAETIHKPIRYWLPIDEHTDVEED